jgi:hypothetical protein
VGGRAAVGAGGRASCHCVAEECDQHHLDDRDHRCSHHDDDDVDDHHTDLIDDVDAGSCRRRRGVTIGRADR